MIYASGQRLIRAYDHQQLWIEPWGENSVRVRFSAATEMPPQDWALLPAKETDATITIDGDTAVLKNGNLTVTMSGQHGLLTFTNQYDQVLLKERWRMRGGQVDFYSALYQAARELRPIPGGDWRAAMRFEADPNEHFFGMGQYQDGCLDLKGCTLELAHRNSQASVPFCISSKGYGLLWNNPALGTATFSRNITEFVADVTDKIDYWVTAGDTPSQLITQYTEVTGRVPMMPEYAMGFWQCKLRYETQDQLMAVAREYRRLGLPLKVIVADFFHWTRQGDFKFEPRDWPDPDAMVKELKELGIETVVSVADH